MASSVDQVDNSVSSLLQAQMGRSINRWSDLVDTYLDDSHRHYLVQLGKMNQQDAVASRYISESGDGRARILDTTLGGQKASGA
jgi:hypothetical protein